MHRIYLELINKVNEKESYECNSIMSDSDPNMFGFFSSGSKSDPIFLEGLITDPVNLKPDLQLWYLRMVTMVG